jgi:hypothetical protein
VELALKVFEHAAALIGSTPWDVAARRKWQFPEAAVAVPVDGVVMKGRAVVTGEETVPYCIWSNKESVRCAQVFEGAAPLKGTFAKLNRSWLMGQSGREPGRDALPSPRSRPNPRSIHGHFKSWTPA